jgi:hypothetical protein
MENKEKLILAFLMFVVIAGVLSAVGQAIAPIDVSQYPLLVQQLVGFLQHFFGSAAVILVLAYFRNLFGYLRNYIAKEKTEAVTFEFKRFNDTILYYLGISNVFLAALPEPFGYLTVALTFIIDVAMSEYKKVSEALAAPAT